jgi:rhodanese-related sulfurtransferase
METIFARELDLYRDSEKYTIIDVRTRGEYAKRHIKGAKNYPYQEIEDNFPNLPFDQEYILYCDKGAVSLEAARELERRGYHARSVIGGIKAYRGKYLTVRIDSSAPLL